MQRVEQLKSLSREHHVSLVMSSRIMKLVKEGSSEEITAKVIEVQQYYNDELELHFQHEEQTLFSTIFKNYPELRTLSTQLLKEHGEIRVLCQSMTAESAINDLTRFAELLKSHTRIEERELFPQVEACFNAEELAATQDFQPDTF
ncbi:MAG: hemerythrin domain-containing protein [Thiotrichaceae bacterium]|nr:hemerythrin domain-containing protein [Thiotrichaceae bacterium]